jgi:predicted DNA-binding ribbon-helix-helix protein
MKSLVVKRSVVLAGHKTSVSLEDAFWERLKDIAKSRRMTLSDLISRIDVDREHGNLSSALRLFVLNHYTRPMSSGLNETMSNADIKTLIETVQSAIM